ncbi:hypothetical protein BMS3Abin17_00539 [archaeon BMS3Abin17]|nr:hypothetical protein BMS3Abin17_00539 [archaeon BMS3Abin17]HDZ60444.1 hypothetical protein [Candidatus Pacearchaeota archaeon]
MEYHKEKKEINIKSKVINELDKFVLDFLKIVQKHVDYVVISGYVSILLGRSRATEDVDIFIKKIPIEVFSKLYKELKEYGFWCLNAEKEEEIYGFLKDSLAIRFSFEEMPVPNFEVKFPKDELDESTFNDFITVILPENKLKISSLERHIAFKRYYLESDKDVEDASHVEETFKGKIDYNKVNKLKELIKKRKEDEKRKSEKNFYETG